MHFKSIEPGGWASGSHFRVLFHNLPDNAWWWFWGVFTKTNVTTTDPAAVTAAE